LYAVGRHDELVPELEVELTDSGYVARSGGEGEGVVPATAAAAPVDPIWDVLPPEPPGITLEEIAERLTRNGQKLPERTIRDHLKKGGARYQHDGTGRKTSPYRYWRGELDAPPGRAA